MSSPELGNFGNSATMSSSDMVYGDDGWISEESDFYGDSHQQSQWEQRLQQPNPEEHFDDPLNYNRIAARNTAKRAKEPPSPSLSQRELYNPYEKLPTGRHLDETVDQFLTRLPPSTTKYADIKDWIWIANPYLPKPETKPDVEAFRAAAKLILDELKAAREDTEQSLQRAGKAAANKALEGVKKEAEQKLLEAAKQHRVTYGKWMLFPNRKEVDEQWAAVAEATVRGQLGPAAKVAADEEKTHRPTRLICIYTHDFANREDVKRVLRKLKDLDLVSLRKKGTTWYYKSDAYTWVGIEGGNEWGLKASMYSSTELLKEK